MENLIFGILCYQLRFCVVAVKFETPPPKIMDDPRCVSQDERRISLSEVYAIERKLWEAIGLDGPASPEARRLYRLVVSSYEDIVLKEREQAGLQEVEYSLWKLHYLHIEEFRKRFKKGPAAGTSNGVDGGIESFLSEATEYYKGLVCKLKELIGKDGDSEMPRTRTRKFLCHRFLICIGDLARYKELYQFTGNRDSDWSIAAAYYLEATRLWPEGGNPHNQLALLATYVGDDFLALYHCVRSLAINEPFPDAWKNLVVLFDKSRSSMLNFIPDQASFDFSRPTRRMLLSSDLCSSEEQHFTNVGGNLWRNFVRTISFFFIDFSSMDFEPAFASTIKELESMMKLDDASMNDALESYQFMNPSRTGPFRAIQAVSVLIFVVQSLINSPAHKAMDDNKITRQNRSVRYAIAAVFVFMGRLIDRCLESAEKAPSPLLPAVLVFSEWLVTSNLDNEEILVDDEMIKGATSYFFQSFTRLLNLLNSRSREAELEGRATLWEDYELRGFSAAVSTQAYLNFSYNSEHVTGFHSNECRMNRIIASGIKIAENPSVCYEQFVYSEKSKQFCYVGNIGEGSENRRIREAASEPSILSRLLFQEEEEVIVFNPLTRHNSAPASKSIMLQGRAREGDDPMGPPDERLLRTSTTLPTQDQGGNEEASSPRKFPVSSGPPSLSAWVLDSKSSTFEKEKAENRVRLLPIEEIMADLLIGRTTVANDFVAAPSQESVITHYPCPPYSTMVPAAPLLPEDTVFGVPENYYSLQPGRIIHSDQASAPSVTGFVDVYPLSHPMTSSEWLRQFREINKLQQGYDDNGPRWHGPNHFHDDSVPRYDHLHPWGNGPPITTAPASDHMFFYSNNQLPQPGYYLPAHGPNEHYRRDRISYRYPRTSAYGYGVSKNDRVDQETLLHYLKQTEWRRLQKDPNLRGPTF